MVTRRDVTIRTNLYITSDKLEFEKEEEAIAHELELKGTSYAQLTDYVEDHVIWRGNPEDLGLSSYLTTCYDDEVIAVQVDNTVLEWLASSYGCSASDIERYTACLGKIAVIVWDGSERDRCVWSVYQISDLISQLLDDILFLQGLRNK